MTEVEQTIFNRITAFGVSEVSAVDGVRRDTLQGLEVKVRYEGTMAERVFFFPDDAHMSTREVAEVIANTLREQTWNSLRP